MFSLRLIIWDLFGNRDDLTDLLKDNNARGLNQRFQELLAGDMDDNVINLINNLVAFTRDPTDMQDRFIPYLENVVGGLPRVETTTLSRKKNIALAVRLISRRGLFSGFEIGLRMIGFDSVVIAGDPVISGFDSPETFDSGVRRFDQRCITCLEYDLFLTGGFTITTTILGFVNSVVEYNEPIFAQLRTIFYNGQPLNVEDAGITGDDSTSVFPLPHSLSSRDLFIQVIEAFGSFIITDVQVDRDSIDQISVLFFDPPATAEDYNVIIRGTSDAFDITGTGAITDFLINHSLSTLDVLIQVYQNTGQFTTVDVFTERTTASQINVSFAVAPVIGEDYRVLLLVAADIFSINGDDVTTDFVINHARNTKNVLVQMFENGATFITLDVEIQMTDVNNSTIIFAVAPTSGQSFRALVF